MIDDMTARRFKEKVQKDYVRDVRNFTVFLGRSPDTARQESSPCSTSSSAPRRARNFADINCIWPSSRSAQGPSTPPSPRERFRRVPGMFSSLEVKVLYPT
jgi:hypothetical protein